MGYLTCSDVPLNYKRKIQKKKTRNEALTNKQLSRYCKFNTKSTTRFLLFGAFIRILFHQKDSHIGTIRYKKQTEWDTQKEHSPTKCNNNFKARRGRRSLEFYFLRSTFISCHALDANTLLNSFSDTQHLTKKLISCLFITSVPDRRLKAAYGGTHHWYRRRFADNEVRKFVVDPI